MPGSHLSDSGKGGMGGMTAGWERRAWVTLRGTLCEGAAVEGPSGKKNAKRVFVAAPNTDRKPLRGSKREPMGWSMETSLSDRV